MPKRGDLRGTTMVCEGCGKEFYVAQSEIGRRHTCSFACMWKVAEERRRKSCVRCGKAFEQSPSVGGKYCSRACYLADRQQRTTCAVCGKKLEESEITYCSRECTAEGRRTLENRPCVICGKPMQVQPYLFATKQTCSRECQGKLRSLRRHEGPGNKIKHDGYVMVHYPDHPDANKAGYIMEHRLVAEQKYGRRILPTEHVHHLNSVRDDNRPENLEIIDPGNHARISNQRGKEQRQAVRAKVKELEAEIAALRAQLKAPVLSS